MKFKIHILFILLSCLSIATPKGLELEVFTGFDSPKPSKDLSKERTTGVMVGVGVNKNIRSRFNIGAQLQYSNLPLNRNGIFDSMGISAETSLIEGDPFQNVSIALQSKLLFPSKSPALSYIFVSPKFNMLKLDDILISTSKDDIVLLRKSENYFSIESGIGLNIEIEKTKLLVETGIDYSFASSENFIIIPIRLGVIIPL